MLKSNNVTRICNHPGHGTILLFTRLLVLLLALFIASSTAWAKKSEEKNISTIGSGAKYTTTVERETKGELSDEDFRQVSTLGSHIIGHLNNATEYLEDNKSEKVKKELGKAGILFKVIRDMLPTTKVTTVVKDSEGKEVYRTDEVVQDDMVPIYEEMIAVDVVQPIEDAKKQSDTLKGLKLADAEVIKTSVLLDLGYVERKINRAQSLMAENNQQALEELVLAQTIGIHFSVNKEDNPLVKAQRALRLAERMVNDKKIEGAESNLRLAKFHLDTYKTLVDKERGKEVDTLQKDIDRLFGTLEEKESESKIRDLWNRMTQWFTRETGQSHKTKPTE